MFNRFGWRPLFFLGSVPALLTAVLVAFGVKESKTWQQAKKETWTELMRTLLSNWKLLLYITTFAMAMHMTSHGTQDMYPTFLQQQWGFSPAQRAALTACSMVGAILGGVLCGFISDRRGRRWAIVGSLLGAVLMVPIWAFAPSVALLVIGAFLIQFFIQGAWGVVPAHLSELVPGALRGLLPGLGNQCGVVLASAVVYIEAVFAGHTNCSAAMAATAGVVIILAIVMTLAGPERRAVEFGA